MNDLRPSHECPHCGSQTFKFWDELSEDDLFIADRMPSSAEFTDDERKKHRICTRCWFEDPKPPATTV